MEAAAHTSRVVVISSVGHRFGLLDPDLQAWILLLVLLRVRRTLCPPTLRPSAHVMCTREYPLSGGIDSLKRFVARLRMCARVSVYTCSACIYSLRYKPGMQSRYTCFFGWGAYLNSKLANVLYAKAFHRHLTAQGCRCS